MWSWGVFPFSMSGLPCSSNSTSQCFTYLLTSPKLRHEEIRSFKLFAAQFGTTICSGLCKCRGLMLEALALVRRGIQIIQNLREGFFQKQTKTFFEVLPWWITFSWLNGFVLFTTSVQFTWIVCFVFFWSRAYQEKSSIFFCCSQTSHNDDELI